MDGMSWSHRMGSRVSLAIAVAIGVAITGCSYGSLAEARIACQKWKKEGPRFKYKDYSFYGSSRSAYPEIEESSTRSCQIEKATNQVLGWVRIPPQGWDHVYLDERMLDWERVVSKRFRWPSR